MASKAKESRGLGKERKISVSIPTTPTKRTPKSSPRSPSTDQKQLFSSSSSTPHSTLSEKPVPNYLKFTASSRPDHASLKPVKKPSSHAHIHEGKPNLNRRRSFDKPPPTTPRLDKPFRSPRSRSSATHVPARSSSFGAKPSIIISSPKPSLLERSSSKISKFGGGKQQQVQSSKSSINVKKSLKRESSNAAASPSAAEMVSETKNAVEYEGQSPSFVLGMSKEDLKKLECELNPCLPDPMPELDKEEADKKDEAEKNFHHHQPAHDTEIFKVDVSNKQANKTPQAADANSSIGEEADQERNEGEREEGSKEEEKPERIEVEKEEVVASEKSTDNNNEEKTVTEEEEQSYKEKNHNSTTKAEKEAEAAEKVAAATTVGKPRQGGPERKESPAMYNHVIEETTSKLMEERKNKVRALAGAFQTVIDYESSSK